MAWQNFIQSFCTYLEQYNKLECFQNVYSVERSLHCYFCVTCNFLALSSSLGKSIRSSMFTSSGISSSWNKDDSERKSYNHKTLLLLLPLSIPLPFCNPMSTTHHKWKDIAWPNVCSVLWLNNNSMQVKALISQIFKKKFKSLAKVKWRRLMWSYKSKKCRVFTVFVCACRSYIFYYCFLVLLYDSIWRGIFSVHVCHKHCYSVLARDWNNVHVIL